MQENIKKHCPIIRTAKKYTTENGLITLYNSLVLPYFTYCSTVWHQGNITHIDKLQKLQKRAARIITSSNYDVRSSDILNRLQWQPIKSPLTNVKK